MASFVLLHSPLVGPTTWSLVAGVLRGLGHRVAVPVLANDASPYWEGHAEQVRASLAAFAPGEPLVFVGHSAAGSFLALAKARSGRTAAAYVFVDAGLPGRPLRTAEELEDLRASVRDGFAPPWGSDWPAPLWELLIPDVATRAAFRAELREIPVGLFEEKLPVFAGWPDARCAYLRFSAFYVPNAEEARGRGWPTEAIDGQHLHMLVDPARVAEVLVRLAG